jgi:hypothetical protein
MHREFRGLSGFIHSREIGWMNDVVVTIAEPGWNNDDVQYQAGLTRIAGTDTLDTDFTCTRLSEIQN